jgi:N-acetylglutamate synthase-like GNAT family acetyltransferase
MNAIALLGNIMKEQFLVEKRKVTKANSDTWEWIIVKEKKEIGCCRFTKEKEHMYIDDVVVKKEHRKNGIGSHLLRIVEEHAKLSGYSEIRGSACAYEKDVPNYREELKSWWEENGYSFRMYSATDDSRHVGNFHKKLTQPVGR